jgi:magnesium-protoporphyrin IX monomethyl ester (oxidative) cyclase
MDFSRLTGHILTQYIAKHSGKSLLVGEWIFSHALYPDRDAERDQEYLDLLSDRLPDSLVRLVVEGAGKAADFISSCALRLVESQPAIVGFSSMFQTHAASLALAAAIKRIDPAIITCIGGANCEGRMGRATVDSFPQVDYVFSGDADETFPDFVERVLAGDPQPARAASIYYRSRSPSLPSTPDGSRLSSAMPIALVERTGDPSSGVFVDLDSLPPPEYDDYFEKVRDLGLAGEFTVGLLVETSRGCWWGEKSHCRFCGLNGNGMNYRSKSPARILEEFSVLTDRWKPDFLQVTDNILDMKHLPVFDALHARGAPTRLYYEVKSNMNENQLRRIALGGVAWVQAGVESLNDDILKLMGKGVTALQNVRLLRNCVELGIVPHWNILTGFPCETPEQYARMAEMVVAIEHLPPPIGSNPIRLVRFSPYYERASDFGYKNVKSAPAYKYIYNIPQEQLDNISYLFVAENDRVPEERHTHELRAAVDHWQLQYAADRAHPKLMWFELNGANLVKDTRAISKQKWTSIGRTGWELLQAFRDPANVDTVLGKVFESGRASNDVQSTWRLLVDHRFVLTDGDRALSVVVDPRRRVRPAAESQSRPDCLGERIEEQIALMLHGPGGNVRNYHLQYAPTTARVRKEEAR